MQLFRSFLLLLIIGVLNACSTLEQSLQALKPAYQQVNEESVASYLEAKQEQELYPKCVVEDQALTSFVSPTADNLWYRLREDFSLDYELNSRLEKQLNRYLKQPRHIKSVLNNAEPYLYYLVETLEAKNLPGELALIPMVESAWDPYAFSHGGAAGLWQFIPSTGKAFGLEQNWWYDGRRDIVASTEAAASYLEYLYGRMGNDWLLAMAAYNAGEGNVRKAVKRNKKKGRPTDFWSLDLPAETEAYIPKILALAEILKRQDSLAIEIPTFDNKPFFAAVDVGHQIDLTIAAKQAGLSQKELYALNPGLNRWSTPPKGPHRLLVPVSHLQQLETNLARLDQKELVQWQDYRVKSGDSLIKIAKEHHIDVSSIRKANQLTGNLIRQGQRLLIPTRSDFSSPANPYQNQLSSGIPYIVKSGDSLWSIARENRISTRTLARWNKISISAPLQIGQKLLIKNGKSEGSSGITRKVSYRVKGGDSVARIADRFNVKIKDIIAWNTLEKSKYIHPGDKLTLYVDVTRMN